LIDAIQEDLKQHGGLLPLLEDQRRILRHLAGLEIHQELCGVGTGHELQELAPVLKARPQYVDISENRL
jgi:hypothetical protein